MGARCGQIQKILQDHRRLGIGDAAVRGKIACLIGKIAADIALLGGITHIFAQMIGDLAVILKRSFLSFFRNLDSRRAERHRQKLPTGHRVFGMEIGGCTDGLADHHPRLCKTHGRQEGFVPLHIAVGDVGGVLLHGHLHSHLLGCVAKSIHRHVGEAIGTLKACHGSVAELALLAVGQTEGAALGILPLGGIGLLHRDAIQHAGAASIFPGLGHGPLVQVGGNDG